MPIGAPNIILTQAIQNSPGWFDLQASNRYLLPPLRYKINETINTTDVIKEGTVHIIKRNMVT
jgi:hypothetical protein